VTAGRLGYRGYRPCLRWEFGFTCAFCLLHEADFLEHGAEGSGLTSIEHRMPVSTDPRESNRYENCFYACRFCNRSRSDAPLADTAGRRLLDSCSTVWADHFALGDDDRLAPLSGDAAYTEATYDLNDPRKTRLRRLRRERMEKWLRLLAEGPRQVALLLAHSGQVSSLQEAGELVEAAEQLRDCVLRASREIVRYLAIPRDSDEICRCRRSDYHSLPPWLDDQTLEI
jgi:hypothetical protein